MDKKELYNLIRNMQVGNKFYNLRIDGVKDYEVNSILQELARERKMQFKIKIFYIKDKSSMFGMSKCIRYTVINPSTYFLNKKGYWKLVSSKIAKCFLDNYKDSRKQFVQIKKNIYSD